MAGIKREGVASSEYQWYLGAQVLSLFGTMMSYTALFWLGPGLAIVACGAALTVRQTRAIRRA